ncbi:MAG: response regulator [Bacteroidales bacterium]|nr:response regulator [Bacteroidales bacterium]
MKKSGIIHLVFLAILILFHTELDCYGDENELRFTYINTDNGLSNNIINAIIQDPQGYMWIGTMGGLNRFDGCNNKIFEKILEDSTSLADNMVYSINIDYKGSIWVGTQLGLCLYNSDRENFKTYLLDEERYSLNTANRVTGIEEDSENNLYVAAEIGFLYLYDRNADTFINESYNFRSIKDFVIDEDDNFWLGGIFGLYYYNKKEQEVIHYDSFVENGKEYPIQEIVTIYEEGDTIWIGTIKGKILYLLRENKKLQMLDYDFGGTYFIYDIFKDSRGLMYFCTTSGMFVYNKETNHYIPYQYDKNNRVGLNSLGITKVYEDMQGNLWIGTYQGGINLAVSGKAFKNYNTFSKGITLDIININTIEEDHQGNLWLGSFNLGVNFINIQTGERKLFMPNNDEPGSLGYGSVYEIFEDSKNNLWIGTYLGNFQKLKPGAERFTSYPVSFGPGRDDKVPDVRSIEEDKEGNLWVICHGGGLNKFNPETKESKCFRQDGTRLDKSLADNYAFQVLIDHEGILWIATPSGLSEFNPQTEEFRNYYHSENDSLSLCNNYITVIFEDSNFNLWIGTSFGLSFFDRINNVFYPFYEKNGLPSNQIKAILEHKPGELWISTAYGLSRMRYKNDTLSKKITADFRNYNQSDNLQDIFFWERSACKTLDGELIFGCEKGIVMFDPDKIKDNTRIPEIYITGFKLFNKPVSVGEYNSILTKNISQTSEISLKYDQNILSFEFVAINYIANQNNQYAYKMEGFDADWVEVGNKREATYTNLDPGTYTFRVKASNNDGYWNEEGTSIKLIILPPFWKTWWFRILLFLGILSVALSYYLFRINLLKNQNVILEERVRNRTRELSALNTELVEKHNRILVQNEEILTQNKEIQNKTEEISVQKELLEEQKSKVEKAYEELTQYRNKLEELVDERTKELIIAKEKAEESDQLKSSFLANLSHEIRTPLNSIIGFTGLFFDPEINDSEKQTFKTIIDSSSNTLLNLINDIIDFSKIEAKHLDIHINDVYINSIFNELERIYNLEIKRQKPKEDDKKINFKINIDRSIRSLVVKTDEMRLKQILSNLINNAIKFTDEGYIEVGCHISKENANYLEFFIKDTGIGIKKEDQKIIFQRFRKVEDDRDYLYRGAGLGLTICQHLIELLKGKIWVESLRDEGSVFKFTIPLDHFSKVDITGADLPDSQEIPVLKNKTILIVEDDYANYSYLSKVLSKTSAKILFAQNGKQGIEMYLENPDTDMILMDIKMPVMNGMEALKELRKLKIKIPVIAQTAYAFSDEIRKIKDVGFIDFISKPIASKDLYNLVAKHLK